jgi:hypothetical protein
VYPGKAFPIGVAAVQVSSSDKANLPASRCQSPLPEAYCDLVVIILRIVLGRVHEPAPTAGGDSASGRTIMSKYYGSVPLSLAALSES